jgi:hypothetical protein
MKRNAFKMKIKSGLFASLRIAERSFSYGLI